jgi:hypothetical protein
MVLFLGSSTLSLAFYTLKDGDARPATFISQESIFLEVY